MLVDHTRFLALVAALAGGVACSSSSSSNPSTQDAAKETGTALCQKMQSCFASDFAVAYPNGVNDCVQKVVSAAPSGTEACSQSRVDTCTNDIKAEQCPAALTNLATLPASCNGC